MTRYDIKEIGAIISNNLSDTNMLLTKIIELLEKQNNNIDGGVWLPDNTPIIEPEITTTNNKNKKK